jgi:hypothetical protein
LDAAHDAVDELVEQFEALRELCAEVPVLLTEDAQDWSSWLDEWAKTEARA